MSSPDDTLRSLREAMRVSPRNVPLRQHLARTLVTLGRFAEAETELREALAMAPDNVELKVDRQHGETARCHSITESWQHGTP